MNPHARLPALADPTSGFIKEWKRIITELQNENDSVIRRSGPKTTHSKNVHFPLVFDHFWEGAFRNVRITVVFIVFEKQIITAGNRRAYY